MDRAARALELAERAAELRHHMNQEKAELALIADELRELGEERVSWVDSGKRFTVDVITKRTTKFDLDKMRLVAPEIEDEFSKMTLDEARLKAAIARGEVPGFEKFTYIVESAPYTKVSEAKDLGENAGTTGGNGESK